MRKLNNANVTTWRMQDIAGEGLDNLPMQSQATGCAVSSSKKTTLYKTAIFQTTQHEANYPVHTATLITLSWTKPQP